MKINPIKLSGPWKAGFALDFHTVSSEYIGDDEYGHPQFETIRSEVGELLFQLKYRSDKTVAKVMALTAAKFVRSQKWSIDVIVPVPPSQPNRPSQPVARLARGLGNMLEVPACLDCVVKVKNAPELKNIYDLNERSELLKNAYTISAPDVDGKQVLVLDDLYRSGATLSAVVGCLKKQSKPSCVYALTFTKSRANR